MGYKKNLAITATIAGSLTLALHFTNKIITYISTVDNNLNTNNGAYYNCRFGKIFYKKSGKGRPLLLIHDLESCSSGFEWNKVEKELSKKHTVYTLDLLGFGRSDKANITYTNFLYVQLLTNFIKDIIGEKVNLISSGESSQIVIMSAAFDEDCIESIILTNPSSLITSGKIETKLRKQILWLYTTPILGTFLYNMKTSKKQIEEKFFTEYFYNPEKIIDNDIKTYYEAAHLGGQSSKYLHASISSNYLNTNICHALKSLNTKIHIISSGMYSNSIEDDRCYLEYENVEELVIISETGKYPHMESPEKYVETVNTLLN